MPCGDPIKSLRTLSIVQIIFSYWSFDISDGILSNQEIYFLTNVLIYLAPFGFYYIIFVSTTLLTDAKLQYFSLAPVIVRQRNKSI